MPAPFFTQNMKRLFDLIKNVENLDMDQQFTDFMKTDKARAYILSLNRWGQLYDQGIDINGIPLGYYRPYTLAHKIDPNLSHITLHETGMFYRSFRVDVFYGYAEISADTMKQGRDLTDRFGEIVGLSGQSKELLGAFFIKNGFNDQIREAILRN